MTNHHVFWHNHYNRHRMFYGPSRLVWFTIGSVATWAWIHHHRKHNGEGCSWRVEHSRRDRVDYPRTPAQDNASSSSSPPPPPDYTEWQRRQQQQQQPREWSRPAPTYPSQSQGAPGGPFGAHVLGSSDAGLNGNGSGPAPQREPGVAGVAAAAAAERTVTAAETTFPLDLDAERLRQIGRNAEETVSIAIFSLQIFDLNDIICDRSTGCRKQPSTRLWVLYNV